MKDGEDEDGDRRRGARLSVAALLSMDLPRLSWVLHLGLYPGTGLVFMGWESYGEKGGL